MNAPRALPIVSGPVGLADTNSTLTERAGPARRGPRPRVGEDARRSIASRAASVEPHVEEARWRDLDRRDRRSGGRSAAWARDQLLGERRRRSPAAPGDTAGRASARGWWRSRRAPGQPALDLDRRAAPSSACGQRPASTARSLSALRGRHAPASGGAAVLRWRLEAVRPEGGLLRRVRRIVTTLANCTEPYRTALLHTSVRCESGTTVNCRRAELSNWG